MTRLRGWAPKGERLVDKVPHGRWKTATFLAALRNDRIEAPCLFDGPINGERFHAYVEQFLVPTLKPGDVVILDKSYGHRPSDRPLSSTTSPRWCQPETRSGARAAGRNCARSCRSALRSRNAQQS